jgi:hypothetical protein
MMTNPFEKETVFVPKWFVGRDQEIRQTLQRLANPLDKGSSAVYGESGVGKTWFLERLKQPDLLTEWGLAEPQVSIVSLNCVDITPWSPKAFWWAIWEQLQAQDIPPSEQEIIHKQLSTAPQDTLYIGQLLNQIVHNERFLIVLLDNFEGVIENIDPENPTFLSEMRAMLTRVKKGLGVVLTTKQHLEDYLIAVGIKFGTLSPFNIFQIVGLSSFSPEETEAFIKVRLKDTDLRLSEIEIKNLFEQTGGWPEQLRIAFYQLIQTRHGNR